MSALPPIATAKADFRTRSCPLYPRKQTCASHSLMSALGLKRTHAAQQKSGRASPMISFMYLSAECLFNKFYGVNCLPKFGAKLIDRFFHLRWQVSPPVNSLRHRFLDCSQHVLYCNVAIGSRHDACRLFTQKITLSYRIIGLLRMRSSSSPLTQ